MTRRDKLGAVLTGLAILGIGGWIVDAPVPPPRTTFENFRATAKQCLQEQNWQGKPAVIVKEESKTTYQHMKGAVAVIQSYEPLYTPDSSLLFYPNENKVDKPLPGSSLPYFLKNTTEIPFEQWSELTRAHMKVAQACVSKAASQYNLNFN